MDDRKPLLFTLFRAQVHLPEQLPLLTPLRSPGEILKAALLERPTVQHPRGSWHIGNVTDVPPSGLYFAIGKQLPKQMGVLDDEGDFHTHSAIVAPNTHAVLDLHYQVLGIAKNTELAPEPKAVARKLQSLLQATKVVQDHQCKISIGVITDPTEFVEILGKAAAVTKFQVSYGLPNVWDAEEDFQQPIQKTAKALGSDVATATFSGEDLDREKLIKLTRAAAAVGKRAKAWVRRKKNQRPTPVSTKENPATQAADAVDESHPLRWAQATLQAVRLLYEDIRRRGQ